MIEYQYSCFGIFCQQRLLSCLRDPNRMLQQVLYLKVTVAGRVDPTIGMVLNISDLKVHLIIISRINMVWYTFRHLTKKVWIQKVLKKIDHHNIDKEVEPFTEGQVSQQSIKFTLFKAVFIYIGEHSRKHCSLALERNTSSHTSPRCFI